MTEIDDIRHELDRLPTKELIGILRDRDEEQWRPEVFDVVSVILESRGVSTRELEESEPEGPDVEVSEPDGLDVKEVLDLVTVGEYCSPLEAQADRLALEAAGLGAWMVDENMGAIYNAGVHTKLQVRSEDLPAALKVLEASPAPSSVLPPDLAEPPCPKCGGREVTEIAEIVDPSSDRCEWRYSCASCGNRWTE